MRERLQSSVKAGAKNGVKTGWWIVKMMVPITLGVAILKWAGVISVISDFLAPAFGYMGLSGDAVVIFITNALSPLYSGIALIATLDIDYRAATILAVMGLICHNLIVETVIQRKAGSSAVYIVILRIGAAIVAGVGLNYMLPADYSGSLIVEPQIQAVGFLGSMQQWGVGIAQMIPLMFALIVALNILQQLLREFKLIDMLTIPVQPIVRALGLDHQTSFLWIVLNTLGLAYGGSVMIAELENGEIPRSSAKLLNTHVAITHSLLEDTLIFVAIGLSAFWLIVPRVLLSFAAVWCERGIGQLKAGRQRCKQS